MPGIHATSKMYGGRGIVLSKWLHIRKLSLELLLSVVIALGVGACIYFPMREGLYAILDQRLADPNFYEESAKQNGVELQRYVKDVGLASSDTAALDKWAAQTAGRVFYLWKNNKLIYATGLQLDKGTEIIADSPSIEDTFFDGLTLTIQFSDGPATAIFYFYYADYYFLLLNVASTLVAFIAVVAVLLLLVRRKTTYISQLERELRILEGGDLSYAITVRGHDELAELARGIDDMRRSIIDREQREKEARDANHALVTAMSHDLRSPLTALIGYLDLIREGKCSDLAQERHFLEVGRNKAYQIKVMSDKLFEYFLVYDTASREITSEQVDGQELLNQVVEEGLFDLENCGFQVERVGQCPPCQLHINIALFRRLFGNLFSNIEKYADLNAPVIIAYELRDNGLGLYLQNRVATTNNRAESTEIGLNTCKKIVTDFHGHFQAGQVQNEFHVDIWFPTIVAERHSMPPNIF